MQIVDRRLNPKSKSLGNRQRFLRRAKAEIREAIKDSLQIAQGLGGRGRREGHHPLQEPARALLLARPQHRPARLRAARQRGVQGRRRDPEAPGRRRRARQPGQSRRRGPGRVHLHADQGRVPRPVLRRPQAAQPDQGQAQGPEGAQAGARRLHQRRPARPPQPHPHHAQEPGPAHGAAAAEPGRDRAAARRSCAAAEAESPADDGQGRGAAHASSSTSSGCAAPSPTSIRSICSTTASSACRSPPPRP